MRMMQTLARFIFWLFGWKTEGKIPPIKKFVAIAGPHTSGWDFVVGVLGKYIYDLELKFLGKEEIFRFPFKRLLYGLGGIPVNRSSSHHVVDQVVKMFNKSEHFILALSPEGTRQYVPKWRKGFYYIALGAKVPIVMCYIDFANKKVGIGPTFYPTGNYEKDLEEIMNFYRPIKGRHPELGVQ